MIDGARYKIFLENYVACKICFWQGVYADAGLLDKVTTL